MKAKTNVYLAGPMRGLEAHNFPAFHAATHDLRSRGYEVWSPAEREEALGFNPTRDTAKPLREYMRIDLPALLDCDMVYVLPGWRDSQGATLEVQVAEACEIPVLDYETDEVVFLAEAEEVGYVPTEEGRRLVAEMSREERVVDPVTGGAKGRKLERYDLVPWVAFDEVARVYGVGASKYADWNWLRGYDWSLSLGALVRHVSRFAQGEDHDSESGLHHLGHAAWHCLTLMTYQSLERGRDDRMGGQL